MKAIHHKNGNPNDNRPENVEEIETQQGKTFRDFEPERDKYGSAADIQEHIRYGGTREDY